jgi:hypothetical protein
MFYWPIEYVVIVNLNLVKEPKGQHKQLGILLGGQTATIIIHYRKSC